MALAVLADFLEFQSGPSYPEDQRFTVRAGISSGPIVAGVIGREKFCW
jgi:hypothetical protein